MPKLSLMRGTLIALILVLDAGTVARAQLNDWSIDMVETALASGDARRALELARSRPVRDARTLATIGRAYAALGEPLTAIRFYRRALAAPGVRRHLVLELLEEARAELAIVRVDLQPGDADLTVDGGAAEWEVGERLLLLAPGPHELVARASGRQARFFSATLAAGSVTEVRFLLPAGDDRAEPESIPSPREPRRVVGLERDLVVSAVGLAGAGVSATWAADRARAAACTDGQCDGAAGAALEAGWASLHTGLSLGLLLGAQTNIVLSWATADGDTDARLWPRLALIAGAMAAMWLSVPATASSCEGDASCADGSALGGLAVGAGLGVIATQLGAVLDDHLFAPLGTVVAGAFLAIAELAIGVSFLRSPDERWDAYRDTLPEGADVCAAIQSGDTRAGRFEPELGHLRAVCSEESASDTLFGLSFGIAGALLAASSAAILVPLFVRLFPRHSPESDLAVAVGPGSIMVSGRM